MITAPLDVDNRTAFSVAVFYSHNLCVYAVRFVSAERAFRSGRCSASCSTRLGWAACVTGIAVALATAAVMAVRLKEPGAR
jgi:hypothetical protein